MDIQNELNGIAEQPLTTAPFQQTADPVCPRCGKVNLADGGFCRFCGSPLSAPQPAPAPTPAAPFSQGAMGSAYQQNTMQGSTYQQNTMQGSAYQPQYQGYNYNQSPMGMGGFYNPNPIMLDPRFQQFTTSALQQGQREIVRCMSVSKAYGRTPAVFPVYVWERIKIGCRWLLAQVFVGWAGIPRPLQLATTRCY